MSYTSIIWIFQIIELIELIGLSHHESQNSDFINFN